jgi:hypothetical protein
MQTGVEVCENCGRSIGKLETPRVHKGHVVCALCEVNLRTQSGSAPAPPAVPNVPVAIPAIPISARKPWKVTAIGGMRIGSGVCNIIAGIVFFWLILPLGLIALGIIEIISGSNLLAPQPRSPNNPKTLAILEIIGIVTLAGWIPLVVGILSLVWLSDDVVTLYFGSLPGAQPPVVPSPGFAAHPDWQKQRKAAEAAELAKSIERMTSR